MFIWTFLKKILSLSGNFPTFLRLVFDEAIIYRLPVIGSTLQSKMADKDAKKGSNIVIAVDGSEHSKRAFDCKSNYPNLT